MAIETEEQLDFAAYRLELSTFVRISRLKSIANDPEKLAAQYDIFVGKVITRLIGDNDDLYMKWELEIKPDRRTKWVEDFIEEMGDRSNDPPVGRGR